MQINENQVKQKVIDILVRYQPIYRKELISRCLVLFDLSKKELMDVSSESRATHLKSHVGTVIAKMVERGTIAVDADKKLSLVKGKQQICAEDAAERFIRKALNGTVMSKNELFSAFIKQENILPENKALRDSAHSLIGSMLSKLIDSGAVAKCNNGYYLSGYSKYPNTEVGICLNNVMNGGDLFSNFKRAINVLGGEFFEQFSVNLLKTYFEYKHDTVTEYNVLGGSNDGGIDGVIKKTDELGYSEKIYIQSKNRNTITVTSKEVREFYGAMKIAGGSNGVFITTSSFHYEAERLLKKIPDLVGIDGKRLFELATITGYGLKKVDGKTLLDEAVFLS